MSQSRQAIQTRIKSVESTKKITRAMQLVASSKLTKQKDLMEKNREYANCLLEMLSQVISSSSDTIYHHDHEGLPSYIFVITSDMGLCGGYNANALRYLNQVKNVDDKIVIVGSRGLAWAKSKKIEIIDQIIDLEDSSAYFVLSKKVQEALNEFENQKISRIQILYTEYKNSITFEPVLETILPIKQTNEKKKEGNAVMIFEPSQEEILQSIIPMVTKSIVYSRYLESKTSEQASRRAAMESATDNADELQEKLELDYNQARQSAITQEITEIVAGSNGLV